MKKKQATLSDKINKLFASANAKEQPEESDEETAPKFSEFDEIPEDDVKNAALSEFRKRNIQFLEDIDRKYKGAVSSRKEASDTENSEEQDEESNENDLDEEDDDDFDERKTFSHKPKHKSLVLLKRPISEEDSDEPDDGDVTNESYEDDDDQSADEQEEPYDGYLGYGQQSANEQITLIREENQQEAISKGLAVQNQLKLWERMLEMRIKFQPCLIKANGMPPGDAYEKLRTESEEFREKANETSKIIAETLDRFLELQESLMGQFSETRQLLKSGSKRKVSSKKPVKAKRIALEDYGQCLDARSMDMVEYRNSVLMKWHDRTKIASSARNPNQTLSVLKKIEDSLVNREDLIRKTQLYRGGYTLYGRHEESKTLSHEEKKADGVVSENDTMLPVYDREIYDDSDFYHQLLRELIEYKTSTTDSPQEITNKLAELQKLRNKMKKNVDTRASKGRKIRYVVHNKLINYMAPIPDYDWTDEAKDELFGSLFGGTPSSENR